jgi:LPS sulfotransferase NodH
MFHPRWLRAQPANLTSSSYTHQQERNGSTLFTKRYGRTLECTESRGDRRPIPFIVFGNQRTGSTLVSSKLNSHSRIVCYEEVLLPRVDSEPSLRGWLDANNRPQWVRAIPGVRLSFLNSIFEKHNLPRNVNAVGFKVMYNQMSLWPKFAYLAPRVGQLFQDRSLERWLSANQVVVIHTLRRNRLKVLVSHQLAAQSGRFHSREAPANNKSVIVPLRGLEARLSRIESAEKVARDSIKGLPTVEVLYEDYVSSVGIEQDAVLCAALGEVVPTGGLSSRLTKLASDDLRATVANYDQVAARLSGTRFERFLT